MEPIEKLLSEMGWTSPVQLQSFLNEGKHFDATTETRVDSPVAHAIITNVALEIFLHKNWRGRKSRAGHHYVITQAPAINQFHKKLLSIFLLMFFLTFLFVKTRDTNGHDRLYFAAKRNGTSNCFHKAFIKWTRIRQKETRARSGSKQANSIKTSDVLAVKTSA